VEYDDENIPGQVDYVVRIVKSKDGKARTGKETGSEYSTWTDKQKKDKLVIYKVIH